MTFLDNNQDVDVSVSLCSSYDRVSSNRQRHDLGNFIVREMLAFDVFKELSIDRVDGERAAWKVPCVAIVDSIGDQIDLELSL